ncbi:helix-turn-helix domain-containing protein [Petrachloros mirabilis]
MESIGEFFRQVRETKGLTIEEVASKTRIRADFVRALEEGNFAKLPDQVFARGFVRSYARSLGLDEEDAIHRFIQSAGAFYEKQDERERLKARQAEEERKRRANRKAVVFAIAIAILTLVVLLSREQSSLLVRRTTSDAPSAAQKRDIKPSSDVQQTLVRPDEHSGGSIAKKKGEETSVSSPPRPDSTPTRESHDALSASSGTQEASLPVPPALGSDSIVEGISSAGASSTEEPLKLDLEATELSWVVLQIDGGSPQEALLRPGEKAKWEAQEQFVITLGNAGGVKAELNGKPQKPFGPSGKVVRDILIKR